MKMNIPDIVIGRLPIYLRTLKQIADERESEEREREYQRKMYPDLVLAPPSYGDGKPDEVSSDFLGKKLGISSAQIRKDLSHFGEFGKQGTGYNIPYLSQQLEKILRIDSPWPVVLVGAGNLGRALASYGGFENRGFRIVAIFDSDERKLGMAVGELGVLPLDAITATVGELRAQIAIIAVPAEAAQKVANTLVAAGIRSILCYAPISLTEIPEQVRVEYIDPVIHLQHMTFYLDRDYAVEAMRQR